VGLAYPRGDPARRIRALSHRTSAKAGWEQRSHRDYRLHVHRGRGAGRAHPEFGRAERVSVPQASQMPTAGPAETRGLGRLLSRLRSYFVWDPLIWLYTIVLGALSLISSLFDKSGRIQHGFARLWSRIILGTIGAHPQVEGLEKVDTTKANVYV